MQQVQPVQLEIPEHKDLSVLLVQPVQREQLVQPVMLDLPVRQDRPDRLVLQDLRVLPVRQAQAQMPYQYHLC